MTQVVTANASYLVGGVIGLILGWIMLGVKNQKAKKITKPLAWIVIAAGVVGLIWVAYLVMMNLL